jgi:hypothetical protein
MYAILLAVGLLFFGGVVGVVVMLMFAPGAYEEWHGLKPPGDPRDGP